MRVEQEQKVTEDARRFAEQDAEAQRYAAQVLQVVFLLLDHLLPLCFINNIYPKYWLFLLRVGLFIYLFFGYSESWIMLFNLLTFSGTTMCYGICVRFQPTADTCPTCYCFFLAFLSSD